MTAKKRSRRTRRVRQVEILGEEDAYMGDVSLHQRLQHIIFSALPFNFEEKNYVNYPLCMGNRGAFRIVFWLNLGIKTNRLDPHPLLGPNSQV